MEYDERVRRLRRQVELNPDSIEAKERLAFVEHRIAPYVPPVKQRFMPAILAVFMRTLGILCLFVALIGLASALLGGQGIALLVIFGFFGMIALYLSKL